MNTTLLHYGGILCHSQRLVQCSLGGFVKGGMGWEWGIYRACNTNSDVCPWLLSVQEGCAADMEFVTGTTGMPV